MSSKIHETSNLVVSINGVWMGHSCSHDQWMCLFLWLLEANWSKMFTVGMVLVYKVLFCHLKGLFCLVVGTVRAKNIAYQVVVRCCYVTSVFMYLIDLQLRSKETSFKIGVETAFACTWYACNMVKDQKKFGDIAN